MVLIRPIIIYQLMTALNIGVVQNRWVYGLCLSSGNTTFRKLDLLPSSGEARETPTLLDPLERANLNHWTRTETDHFRNVVFSST
jgi:hypothetical protein